MLCLTPTFGVEGGVSELKTKTSYMNVLMLSVGVLLVIALVSGWVKSDEVTFALEINTLKSPFFKLGLFSERFTLDDGSVEDEIVIGLFFVNVIIIFWKEDGII